LKKSGINQVLLQKFMTLDLPERGLPRPLNRDICPQKGAKKYIRQKTYKCVVETPALFDRKMGFNGKLISQKMPLSNGVHQ
jgi:hypothetical protein